MIYLYMIYDKLLIELPITVTSREYTRIVSTEKVSHQAKVLNITKGGKNIYYMGCLL